MSLFVPPASRDSRTHADRARDPAPFLRDHIHAEDHVFFLLAEAELSEQEQALLPYPRE